MSEALKKVDEKIKALAVVVEGALSFDDDGDCVLPETFSKDNLALASGSEELSMEQVELVQNTTRVFAGGLGLGLGNAAQKAMEKNKDLGRATGSLTFGQDTIRAAVDKQTVITVPTTGEKKDKFGALSIRLDSGAAGKRGDIKKVITAIGDNFAGAFGEK